MANKDQRSAYPIKVRQKWYFMVEKAGKTVDEVCAMYLIPRKTYYKWRNIDQGSRVHGEKKERPHTKIKGDIKVFISEQKLRLNYGPQKMRLLVKRRFDADISTTAIYKFYKKKGLVRRVQKKLPWYTPLKDRLVPTRPGEVVQADAKYVWEDGVRKYQRTFIDIFTGRQHAVVASTMTAEDTISAFEEAEQIFPFPILGVQSDNGSENRGEFHHAQRLPDVAFHSEFLNSPISRTDLFLFFHKRRYSSGSLDRRTTHQSLIRDFDSAKP